MEEDNGDPYEEQLLALFDSCLAPGVTRLCREGLRTLCDKLQLEERGETLISRLSSRADDSVSFAEFRDALLKLLDQTSAAPITPSDANDESERRSGVEIRSESSGDKIRPSSGREDKENGLGKETPEISAAVRREALERIFAKLDSDGDGLISLDELALLFDREPGLDGSNGSWMDLAKGESPVRVRGPGQTGYARIATIVGMWEVAGVADATSLLSDLGFTGTELSLTDLTNVLCEELKSLRDEPNATATHMSLLKGALTLYQEELRCMNTLVEHLSGERDKLRIDVAEANDRANLLAQEIDEHHVRLEKCRQEQLKQLESRHAEITRNLSMRCVTEREAHAAALKNLERQIRVSQQEEQQARAKLADLLRDNQSLENEVEKLCDQITKLKASNGQLLMQMQQLAAEHEEVDTSNAHEDSEEIIELLERIKRLREENAMLRDQNDELTTELEYARTQSGLRAKSVEEISLESGTPRIGESLANGDEDECEERASESLRDLVIARNEKSRRISEDDSPLDKSFNGAETRTTGRQRTSALRDYPPRHDDPNSPDKSIGDSSLRELEAKHALEKRQLIDRCADLERSLDLLRGEYEQCEDYWAGKLEEERQLFEQEQKISDDKFTELIAKMAEYEEQFGPGDKSRNDGRLSPIEEKFHLEQQYTDLEDEYERFRNRTRQAIAQRDNEIKELQDQLSRLKIPSIDVATQFPADKEDTSQSSPVLASTASEGRLVSSTASPGIIDRERFENVQCPDTVLSSPKLRECYCHQIEAYNSMEELCRVHKAELHRLYRKKLEIDNECVNLARQKECLVKGVAELKNLSLAKRLCTGDDDETGCGLSINVLKTMNERLQAQEKKRRSLKISLVHQQHQAERILQQSWQQHCQEVAALHFALQGTKDELKRQIEINHDQAERLAKADILSTDLYVQNAHLMASVKRLEQHCHILAQFGGESTSV